MSSIGEDEQDMLKRLMEVSYYLEVNEQPYMAFHGLIKLEKMHGVKFLKGKSYENETACRDFIQNAADCLFQENLEKLKQANFISVLSDGSRDAAIVKKECIYILFVDPNEYKLKLLLFALKEPISQDADKIKRVGSSFNAGIIAKFKESYNWVVFIWCVSHRLELALTDALKNWFESVDTCIHNLYYL